MVIMIDGLVAKKLGMTQFFEDNGNVIPVTVLEAEPVIIIQKKTNNNNKYKIQIGSGKISKNKINKPSMGHFKDLKPTRYLKEFNSLDFNNTKIGDKFGLELFKEGEVIKVSGTTKGKGFTGVIKRYGFGGQPASHGHRGHRGTGSIGQCATPSRVFKGKKMHGHKGNSKCTTKGLKIIKIFKDESIVLIKGAVPGSNGGIVSLHKIIKKN